VADVVVDVVELVVVGVGSSGQAVHIIMIAASNPSAIPVFTQREQSR
jgi:hypothetical protein